MNDWKLVEDLFIAATECPFPERAAFLDNACAGNATLRAEVESLLAFDSGSTNRLAPIVEAGAAGVLSSERVIGARVGAYRILGEIGHGGMGAVYLAERASDANGAPVDARARFSRQAAIKFIRLGRDTPGTIGRFLRERQILATLDHPYIAKLLDGGATDYGVPYFVMEYVQGTPIDEYCAKHSLTVEARCELFRKVCEAVAYAHRRLVIHRDLKPTNILVTAEGTPILLDFGIAKLLDDATADPGTQTAGTWMLTPDYASPEQVRNLPTTTATDVYSLGVVLYQLLTGAKPFQVDSTTPPLEIARTVCELAPPRPSSVMGSRRLSADLDNIILMALRKEPERRYSSVEQFSEDILRYLKGRPVIARDDTFRYRATKFITRNRTAVAASALAAASLIGAVAMTAHEASRVRQAFVQMEAQRNLAVSAQKRAEQEHLAANEQREIAIGHANEAEAQRRNAQKRLTELVKLGHHSLYEVQGTLEHLPGALEARRDILSATLKYFDGLAAEAKDDPALTDILITGYTQTGDVLGYPGTPNLGDRTGAIEAWRKARRLLIASGKIPRMDGLLEDLGLRQRVGMVLEAEGHTDEALDEYRAALGIAHKLSSAYPRDAVAVAQTGIIEHNLGGTLMRLNDPTAGDHVRAEVKAYERVTALVPEDREQTLGLCSAINSLGQLLVSEHHLKEGLAEFHRSLALRETVLKEHPADGPTLSGIAKSWLRIAGTLGGPWQENLGDPAGAVEASVNAIAIYESLTAADTGNRKAKGDLATALVYAGAIGRGTAESMPRLRRAVSILSELRKVDPKQVSYRTDAAMAHEYLGDALRDSGDYTGAVAEYRLSLEAKDNPAIAARIEISTRR